jgi:hypothetical protein
MPVPDFSPGEVLTAGAMDSIGLWKVASGTLSSTSTNFVGCFTSNYDNYLIVLDKVAVSSAADIYIRFLNGSTPDAGANYFWAYVGYTISAGGVNSNAGTGQTIGFTGITSSVGTEILSSATMTCFSPKLVQRTFISSSALSYPTQFAVRNGMTHNNTASSYDGIQFLTSSAATMSGGVTIYGYRK